MFDQYPSSSLYMNYFPFLSFCHCTAKHERFPGKRAGSGYEGGQGICSSRTVQVLRVAVFFFMGGVLASGTWCSRGWDW